MERSQGRKLYRETREKIILNLVQCELGLISYPDPRRLITSCETFLLDYLDTSESKGQITYIPIDFLRDYAKEKLSIEYNNISEIEEKTKLYKVVSNLINEEFLDNTYKNVPLRYFRKPVLISSLTVTRDHVQVQRTLHEKEYIELGFNYEDIAKFSDALITNQDEWMYLSQIQDYFRPWSLAFQNINLLDPFTSSCPKISNERFSFGMILQNFHFTCYFIDRRCPSKTRTRSNLYFFNSGGYSPCMLDNVNTWSIEPDFKFKRHRNKGTMGEEERNVKKIMNQIPIDNVFFNTFQTQHLNSECGGFTSLFLLIAIHNIIDSTTDQGKGFDFRNVLYIYNNIYQMGYDLTISMIKGLMYFTEEDLKANNLSKTQYNKSADIYPISNRKQREFEELVVKAKEEIKKLSIKN